MEIIIKKSTIKDFNELQILWEGQQKFHHHIDGLVYSSLNSSVKIKIFRYLKNILKNTRVNPMFVAKVNNECVGFISFMIDQYKYFDSNIKKRGFINEFYVSDNMRGKGIGRLLMKHTEEFLKKQKVDIIEVRVSIFNKRTVKLYKELGYKGLSLSFYKKL